MKRRARLRSTPSALLVDFLLKFPFTLLMVSSVLLVGVLTNSHFGPLSEHLLHRFGFAPVHLTDGAWLRLVSSAFVTAGGWTYFITVTMLALCVGTAERLLGTRAACLLFWLTHLLTLLVQSLLLAIPLHHLDVWWGTILATEHDVGPSAGYYGCLGGVIARQPKDRRLAWAMFLLIFLALRLWTSTMRWSSGDRFVSADVSHLIAFFIGMFIFWTFRMSALDGERRQHSNTETGEVPDEHGNG